jgi:hypothetical protein
MANIIFTTVAKTTMATPKLRAKSFWMEEWNNIVGLENLNYEL